MFKVNNRSTKCRSGVFITINQYFFNLNDCVFRITYYIDSQNPSWHFLHLYTKTVCALVDMDLLFKMKLEAESNARR